MSDSFEIQTGKDKCLRRPLRTTEEKTDIRGILSFSVPLQLPDVRMKSFIVLSLLGEEMECRLLVKVSPRPSKHS